MVDFRLLRIQVDSSSVRRAQGDFKGFSDSTGAVNSGLQLLTRAAAGLGAALSAREIVQYADAWRNAENMLRQVTSSTSELTSVQAALKSVANETRSEFGATADLYSRLARSTTEMGLSQQELIGLTTTINQSFAASGATATEAAAAITQLSQGLAAGALRGDEFNSVSEQAPGIMRAISESLGVTIGELRTMASEGAITADVVVTALQGAADTIEGDFNKTMITFGQSVTVAKNNLMEFVGSSESVETAVSEVGEALVLMTENLDTAGQAASVVAAIYAGSLIPSLMGATKALTAMRGAMLFLTGPAGIAALAAGTLATLAFAFQNVRARVEETRESLFELNTSTIRSAEVTVIDLARKINDLGREFKDLDRQLADGTITYGDYVVATSDLQKAQQDLEEDMRKASETLLVLKQSQDENTESTKQAEGSVTLLNSALQPIIFNMRTLSGASEDAEFRMMGVRDATNDATESMQGVTVSTGEATEELLIQRNMIENLQREWANLIDTFIDGESDIGDFFDTFAKGIKRVIAEAASADLVNLVFGGNQGGNLIGLLNGGTGSGGGSGGGAGSLLNLAASTGAFNGLATAGSSIAGMAGFGTLSTTGGWVAPSMANPATLSAAGGGGGFLSGAANFMTSPLGLAIGAAIVGKFVHDATNDPDGFHRAMAGMLVGPTPGAPGTSQFSVTPFASGFAPTGFADGPASQQQALALISQFRGIDQAIVDAVTAAGGRVATPGTLGGFGLDGTGNGTFLGRSQLTTDAEFQLQLNAYARQLAEHIEGLAPDTMAALMGATSAQEIVDILASLTEATEANTAATTANGISIAQSLGIAVTDINAQAAAMGPKKPDPSHGLTLVDDGGSGSRWSDGGVNAVDAAWGSPSEQFLANARAERVQGNLDMIARGYDFVTGTWSEPALPAAPAPQTMQTNALGLTTGEMVSQTVVKMAKDMSDMSKIIQRWEGDTLPANRS